jgi:CheY-like chemotaxis protein
VRRKVDRGTVLVVDDYQDWRETLKRELDEEGYNACAASTREEALRLVESMTFDVIVVDIVLLHPQRSLDRGGIGLLQALTEVRRHAGTQLISFTGFPLSDDILAQLANLNLVAQLTKAEWDQKAFLDAIRRGVEQAHAARQGRDPLQPACLGCDR